MSATGHGLHILELLGVIITPGGKCMPWRMQTMKEQRLRFVLSAVEIGANKARLCREYGISRVTGDKWIQRYLRHGNKGLEDQARRPHKLSSITSVNVMAEIIRIRNEHQYWGGRTIREVLRRDKRVKNIPHARTIDRVLKRCGFVIPRRPKVRELIPEQEVIAPKSCNQVWTVDFKGWWIMGDGNRCEPLTIRDEYSKFILEIAALSSTSMEGVKERFLRLFKLYGRPLYIRSDNGSPFASTQALCGLSRLSIWWMKHDITPNRIPVGSPGMNGAHERMHRDIKRELQQCPQRTLRAEQERFNVWRQMYNHERPHHALAMKTPAKIYRRSDRSFDTKAAEYVYPIGFETRAVGASGQFSWNDREVQLSTALQGERIGLEFTERKIVRIWYRDYMLGTCNDDFRSKIVSQPLIPMVRA